MVFGDVLGRVGGRRRRLVFYNADCIDHCERVIDYAGVHDVEIEYIDDPAEPDSTVSVLDGSRHLASDDIEQVATYIDSWETDLSTAVPPPSIFAALDETIFRSTNKSQLVLASRLIETRAAQTGEGRLAVGFQRLSMAQPLLSFYLSLPPAVTVSLYGEPDWQPPADTGVAAYHPASENHESYWWALFDGTDHSGTHAALVAKETDDTYTGFWTYRRSLVDELREIVDSLAVTQVVGP